MIQTPYANTSYMERKSDEHRCRDNRGRFTQCRGGAGENAPRIKKRTYWSVMSSFLLLSAVTAGVLLASTMTHNNRAIARLENEYNQQLASLTQQLETEHTKTPPEPLPTDDTAPQEIHGEND